MRYKKELTKDIFEWYWINKGHRPACASIDIPNMINQFNNSNKKDFTFFVNKYNFVWMIDKEIKKRLLEEPNITEDRFTDVTISEIIREYKLSNIFDI